MTTPHGDTANDLEAIEQAIERRRHWLTGQITISAAEFGVTVEGTTVIPYDTRSIGAPVVDEDGTRLWLRVVVEDPDYQPACRWEGNVEANAIEGVPKPMVMRWADRDVDGVDLPGDRVRTELMTRVPGTALSADSLLREDPHLPDRWWDDLAQALGSLSAHPAPAAGTVDTLRYLINNVRGWFDVDLEGRVPDLVWTTAHADLHWGNLSGPELAILDWESWRSAPAGYDLATLYCNSLLVPPVADRVQQMGAEVFTTPSGRISLLLAACRYLTLAQDDGPYSGLSNALTALGRIQLAHLGR